MLARAVVLQGTGGTGGNRTLQPTRIQIGPPEQSEGLSGVGGGAGMGSAGDRQPPLAASGAIGGATGHEGGGLEGLEGRADEAELLGIPSPHQHPAPLIADHRMDPMMGFGDAVTEQPHLQGRHTRPGGSRKAGGQGHGGGDGSPEWGRSESLTESCSCQEKACGQGGAEAQASHHRINLEAGHQQILLAPGDWFLPHLTVVPA